MPEIPYDRSSAADIKTIGIITPRFPDDASVVLASSVGQSFGLVGALIDAGMQANRESRLKDALQTTNFSARETFMQAVVAALNERGYAVALIDVLRERDDFVATYPTDRPNVDAFLDLVVPRYGYIAAGIGSTPYRPLFVVKGRLVRASDASVLMQDTVVYNPIGPTADNGKGVVTLAPNPSDQFTDFGALERDPEAAARGMQSAIQEAAQTIGQLLK